jgi:hypothetical protein
VRVEAASQSTPPVRRVLLNMTTVELKKERIEVMKMGMPEFPLVDSEAKAAPLDYAPLDYAPLVDYDVSLGMTKPRRNILTVSVNCSF